jgi:hypothetical protein
MYGSVNDNIEKIGFIDKDKILKYVSEEDIFELVFNFKPQEFDYVTSPFREDNTPGCWFQYTPSGKLKFTDFGSQIYINNTKMTSIDCFDAVKIFYNLSNLYQTLDFIKKHLIDGKQLSERGNFSLIKKDKRKIEIFFEAREFNYKDKQYFKKYEISRQNLIDDKVFAVKRFKIINSKYGDFSSRTYDLCYAHTDFQDSRKKLHRPNQIGKNRFLTNCNQNDIYGINNLINFGELLIISKSYKDYRVLKNQGLNVIAFQNEGMIPSNDILLPILKRFTHVVVFFDNDKTGIEAGKKVSDYINSYFPGKSRYIYLNEDLNNYSITDPSDLIHKKNKQELINFLKQNNLLID